MFKRTSTFLVLSAQIVTASSWFGPSIGSKSENPGITPSKPVGLSEIKEDFLAMSSRNYYTVMKLPMCSESEYKTELERHAKEKRFYLKNSELEAHLDKIRYFGKGCRLEIIFEPGETFNHVINLKELDNLCINGYKSHVPLTFGNVAKSSNLRRIAVQECDCEISFCPNLDTVNTIEILYCKLGQETPMGLVNLKSLKNFNATPTPPCQILKEIFEHPGLKSIEINHFGLKKEEAASNSERISACMAKSFSNSNVKYLTLPMDIYDFPLNVLDREGITQLRVQCSYQPICTSFANIVALQIVNSKSISSIEISVKGIGFLDLIDGIFECVPKKMKTIEFNFPDGFEDLANLPKVPEGKEDQFRLLPTDDGLQLLVGRE